MILLNLSQNIILVYYIIHVIHHRYKLYNIFRLYYLIHFIIPSYLWYSFYLIKSCNFAQPIPIYSFSYLFPPVCFLDTKWSDWERWMNWPIWERPSLVSRIPDMVSVCCGGLLMNVLRLMMMAIWLHYVTQKTEILVSIHSIIQKVFFLILTYSTMKWATCTIRAQCLIMLLSITTEMYVRAMQIVLLFRSTQMRMTHGLRGFMWHIIWVRGASMRTPPSASAKAWLRSFRRWNGQISSGRWRSSSGVTGVELVLCVHTHLCSLDPADTHSWNQTFLLIQNKSKQLFYNKLLKLHCKLIWLILDRKLYDS